MITKMLVVAFKIKIEREKAINGFWQDTIPGFSFFVQSRSWHDQ
jgi:hypothetical protein